MQTGFGDELMTFKGLRFDFIQIDETPLAELKQIKLALEFFNLGLIKMDFGIIRLVMIENCW